MAYTTINVNGFDVPATKTDAIKKMIEGVENGTIHPEACCRNVNIAGKKCPIGYLLTEHQLQVIEHDGELESSVLALSWRYGRDNIETMLGMHLNDAKVIQMHFDGASEDYIDNALSNIETFNKNFIQFLKKEI